MDLGLHGKVALVTGAAQGIGRATAMILAAEGARVLVVDLQAEKAAAVSIEIGAAGGTALPMTVDVADRPAVDRMAAEAVEAFGPVDILIANHAAPRSFGDFAAASPEIWRQNIDINLIGTMNCAQAVLKPMIERGSGRIVNVASRAGRTGYPMCPWYSASKAGVIGFSKSLALDVGRYGITVNAVCPGRTMVERYAVSLSDAEKLALEDENPMGKLAEPRDIADMIVFLCSSRAGHITGETISVDGGYTRI